MKIVKLFLLTMLIIGCVAGTCCAQDIRPATDTNMYSMIMFNVVNDTDYPLVLEIPYITQAEPDGSRFCEVAAHSTFKSERQEICHIWNITNDEEFRGDRYLRLNGKDGNGIADLRCYWGKSSSPDIYLAWDRDCAWSHWESSSNNYLEASALGNCKLMIVPTFVNSNNLSELTFYLLPTLNGRYVVRDENIR